jgi:hypothetical protein
LPSATVSVLIRASLFENWSTPNGQALASLHGLYGDDLIYFGKHLPRGAVLKDQRRFAERWPQRSYRVRAETLRVECFKSRPGPYPFCEASGTLDWDAYNRAQHSSGIASFYYGIVVRDDRPVIWSQDDKVLQRQIEAIAVSPNTKHDVYAP